MSGVVPPFRQFDTRVEKWSDYQKQMEFFMQTQKVNDDAGKKAVLLSNVGPGTFCLLQSLLAPRDLSETAVKIADITKALNDHFDDAPNFMSAAYEFYSSRQAEGQSFADWMAELRQKAQKCGFTTSQLKEKPLDRALRDIVLMGTNNSHVRQNILKKKDPTLADVVQIAKEGEMVMREFEKLDKASTSVHAVKSRINPNRKQKKMPQHFNLKQDQDSKYRCRSCGSTDHQRQDCRFKNMRCHDCKKVGHISRACEMSVHGVIVDEPENFQDDDIVTHSIRCHQIVSSKDAENTKMVFLKLKISGLIETFELDTAANRSIIGISVWKKIGSPPIIKNISRIKGFGEGHFVAAKGFIKVPIQYDGKIINAVFVVVNENCESILGIGNIRKLKLDLNTLVHENYPTVHSISISMFGSDVIQKQFPTVFQSGLGHCTKLKANIKLDGDAVPIVFKPRPIPFARLKSTKQELERLQSLGIIEPIQMTDWAAPVVLVPKPDGTVRLCGDFKVTINKYMKVNKYPIPNIDELLFRLNGGIKFTKLDFSDAYLQVELDDESKPLTTISTPFGYFQYRRMPFGIANAPAIFQNVSDQIISDIPCCANYLDDIIVSGRTPEEHHQNLMKVLKRIEEFGFKCRISKCSFYQDEVSYLGFIISRNGKRANPERINAIQKIPIPTDKQQIERFVGKLNYYSKFIPNFSELCAPLNQLRKHGNTFQWTKDCQSSFDLLKSHLSRQPILIHYNDQLPIHLSTDASNQGVGAVIFHKLANGEEHPIAFASKTLTAAEKNYSTIEKEALGIVFGVKKFNQYLAGRHFTIHTDHQPLISIFSNSKGLPQHTANRIQRWALVLMNYTFDIYYKPGVQNVVADTLSRFPSDTDEDLQKVVCFDTIIHSIQDRNVKRSFLRPSDVATETLKCSTFTKVINFTKNGWPKSFKTDDFELKQLFQNRLAITEHCGVLLLGDRVIIPKSLRERILQIIHAAHLGVHKMKNMARNYCWWPGITRDIEKFAECCSICAEKAISPAKNLSSWPEPKDVWSRLHTDFLGPFLGRKWIVIIDAKSKYAVVRSMGNDTTACNVKKVFDEVFTTYGICAWIVSDNGPPFTSREFTDFLKNYNIEQITTPPYHPQSNGFAERFVRSFKEGMSKLCADGNNIEEAMQIFLRSYNWSVHSSTGNIPAEIMFSRQIMNELYFLNPKQQLQQVHDSKFSTNEPIWYRMKKDDSWKCGIIKNVISSRMYEVQTEEGKVHRCHQDQIRRSGESYSMQHPSFDLNLATNNPIIPEDDANFNSTTEASGRSTPRPIRNRKQPDRFGY